MALREGKIAPDFKLPSIDGGDFNLSDLRGKKILLILNRWASCPFCMLTLVRITHKSKQLEKLGIRIVMIFPSSIKRIKKESSKVDARNIHFLSDEKLSVYKLYQAEASFKGSIRTIMEFRDVMKAMKYTSLQSFLVDGKISQLPSSFLINETGIIDVVRYGKNYTDIIEPQVVEEWAASSFEPAEKFNYHLNNLKSFNDRPD